MITSNYTIFTCPEAHPGWPKAALWAYRLQAGGAANTRQSCDIGKCVLRKRMHGFDAIAIRPRCWPCLRAISEMPSPPAGLQYTLHASMTALVLLPDEVTCQNSIAPGASSCDTPTRVRLSMLMVVLSSKPGVDWCGHGGRAF